MLNDMQLQLIKSTLGVLESAGPKLTAHFYQRLFHHHPELQHIFNMSNQKSGRQQVALFEAIAAYAKNIENVAVLVNAVERIAQKHTSMNIQAAHYAVVGMHLLATLEELAPEVFNTEVLAAWAAAYQILADIFIAREAQLYQERADANGGWQATRQFVVAEKIVESELVTSFVFTAKDERAVLAYLPGQYIGLQVRPTHSEYNEIRQYSLSQASNGKNYRISVKREQSPFVGVVSNYLHDEVNLGDEVSLYPPAGDFYWQDRASPVVLISAGVGITPMFAMLETLAKQGYGYEVSFLHACENQAQHSFASQSEALCQRLNAQRLTWYREGVTQLPIFSGQMELAPLASNLPLHDGHFYLCGPIGFMQAIFRQLIALGVVAEQIHYEVFGPHQGM
jgi:nitric oxide dioxygenase